VSDHPPKTPVRARGSAKAKAGARANVRRGADAGVADLPAPAATADGASASGEPQAQPCFYRPAAYGVDDSVGFLMKKVLMSIVAQADKRLGEHGLTNSQWSPLMRMRLSGACTVAELARWLQTDAGATTRLLDRLEKKGLCQRTRCTEDRRVVRVALTPDGEAAIAEVPAVMSAIMNEHLAGFCEAEWRQMLSLLQRMLRNGEALRDPD
jgi:DNA-binding MarR family transcriptional regulator